MKTLLWIDDCRNPYEHNFLDFSPIGKDCAIIWVKSYYQAIKYLDNFWPDAICFDHDLGEDKTGYDIAKYLVNKCIDNNLSLPKYACHSSNPVGRKNILSLLDNYNAVHSI